MSLHTQDAHLFLQDQCSILQNAESMSEPTDKGDQVSWRKLRYSIAKPSSKLKPFLRDIS